MQTQTQIPLPGKTLGMLMSFCIAFLAGSLPVKCQNPSRPNILVIILDDARYDSFQPNGGPEFFATPAINSIALGGVNFKSCFVNSAVCSASRASIYTGLYTHHHGCGENGESPNEGLTYVSAVLKDAGYYTGFIGKWLFNYKVPDTPIGFNFWAVTDSFQHIDPLVIFNDGSQVQYYGHDTEIFTDLALDFWNNSAPDGQPWLLFMSHRVPHTPYDPRPEDKTLYDNEEKPFPSNFDWFQKNFPSHLYPGKEFTGDSTDLVSSIEGYFETCYGAEVSTDRLLSYLSSHHLLDSTLILFTSDNGYLFGEHRLSMKILAYEESMHVPLFIRYPAWFAPGTIVEDEIAANIDIAPTLLEAAGITDTFDMDGLSLHDLATQDAERQYLFFEQIPDDALCWEAVRSLRYKYIYHYCSNQTEEFFDLVNDPAENINLIFDPSYTIIIEKYRQLRDSLRIATTDTVFPTSPNCSLNSFFYQDADQDTFGTELVRLEKQTQPSGYVNNRDDCDDTNSSINPTATDVCNSIDDNCNGVLDENAITAAIIPSGSVSTCSGIAITLTANSGTGISYQWKKGSNNISGATNSTYSTSKGGNYKVVESNNFSCTSTSSTTTITVLSTPTAMITPLGNLDICVAGSVDLQANSGAGLTYQWIKGSNNIAGATSQIFTATKKGTYKVRVTNTSGCSKTSEGTKVTKSCKEGETGNEVLEEQLTVYPNPAGDKFTVALKPTDRTLLSSNASIEIINELGQLIYSELIPVYDGEISHEISLDPSRADGMYLIKVAISDRVYSRQLVYQR